MMATSKAKAPSKQKKTTSTPKAGKTIKAKTVKSVLSEDDIREKAKEIYHERIARGEHGTAEEDWHKAEQLLAGSRK